LKLTATSLKKRLRRKLTPRTLSSQTLRFSTRSRLPP